MSTLVFSKRVGNGRIGCALFVWQQADGGDDIIATGTPEDVAKVKGSYTGRYLARFLAKRPAPGLAAKPKAAKATRKTAP